MRGASIAAALCLALAGCGGPALQNAPRPNTNMMAGGFAAAAAAVTLASPHDAAKKAEVPRTTAESKPQKVKQNVPPDVFDRLDSGSGAGSGSQPAAPLPAPPADSADGVPLPPDDRPATGR